MKNIRKWLLSIFGFLILVFIVVTGNHNIQLMNEEERLTPLGEMVNVYGNEMHVYKEGKGDKTLIFMSGGRSSSPVLDFKALYSELSDEFVAVVVEKSGYGFSEITNSDRNIEAILSETRRALELAKIEPPYVLVPHALSGLEAIYWAQTYPAEIEAIIGLDMATPSTYENYTVNLPLTRLTKFAADKGFIRLIPKAYESDAIQSGQLTEEEEELYKAVHHRRMLTSPMINEIEEVKENAKRIKVGGIPKIPIHLFSSNGERTGFSARTWLEFQTDFAKKATNGQLTKLDVPHSVHNYAYKQIAYEIREFLR